MVPLCGGGAGARLLRMAGAGRRLLLLNAARGSGSQAGGSAYTGGKALAVKKRGYDITRNPHLNKVDAVCLPSAPHPPSRPGRPGAGGGGRGGGWRKALGVVGLGDGGWGAEG